MDGMQAPPADEARLKAMVEAGDFRRAEPLLRGLHAREGMRLWSGNLLAICLRQQRRYAEAVPLYRRLIAAAPAEAALWRNLANALSDALRWREAAVAHRRALSLAPEAGAGWAAYGRTLARMGEGAEARLAFERAIACGPEAGEQARIEWDICLTRLAEGDYAGGWPLYDRRWAMPRSAPRPDWPRWDGRAHEAITLFLHAEQGFGDTLQCLRYLPQAASRVGRLVLAIQPALMRLVAGAAPPGTIIVPQGSLPEPGWMTASLLDLPRFFSPSPSQIPGVEGYLRAPAGARARMRALLPPAAGLRVGIVWSGSAGFQHNDARRASPEEFLSAFDQPGVALFSLQKGPQAAELAATPGARVTDLAPHLDDFADTAAACEALDLVIMTDSAVAHLCGALGRPVWVMLGPMPHWPWGLAGETTPWYRSMRLFRQAAPGCRAPVLDQLAGELSALIGVEQAPTPGE